MYGVHAQVTRLALGGWAYAAPRSVLRWGGCVLKNGAVDASIAAGATQVIQVRHRDAGEDLVLRLLVDREGALGEFLGGGSGEGAVQLIDLGKQPQLDGAVALGKGYRRWPTPVGQATAGAPLRNQARDLRSGVAGDLAQEANDEATLGSAQPQVAELLKALGDPVVAILVRRNGKRDGCGARHERAHLF